MRQSGVTFQVVPAGGEGESTRMDVAAFVGLAMSGPLHTPVPVEDPVQFDQIFGGTYTLLWDRCKGAAEVAHLRAAVHSFFAGGGARCWVVRAAGDRAVTSRFVVPGVMRMPGGTGSPRSALLKARSCGAWSDRLLAGTSLHRTSLGNCRFEWPNRLHLDPWMLERVATGDLLRVAFAGQKHLVFLTADQVGRDVSGRAFWFRLPDLLPVADQRVQVLCQSPLASVAAGAPAVEEPVVSSGYWTPRGLKPELLMRAAEAPHAGAAVLVTFAHGPEVVLNVAGVREATREERQRWTGELGDLMVVTLREPLEILRPLVPPDGLGVATAERLAFHLWVQDGDGRLCTAKELGFTGRHPRFAGFLPDDETLFALPMGRGTLRDGEYPGQALWPQVKEPRFPLAAADQNAYVQTEDVWLPLGMGLAGPDLIAGAIHTGESPLERDGLEDWSPALLADPLLLESPVEVLESELLQRITEATTPLKG
ncbi:MAG TPA: hypothetical protein VNT75_30500, partial [Symbiobacteriaceae bacterium]|nr:hypothetical protein [Symbiobacteriaceae bacterium]